jgi:hypothetical protein
MELKISKSVASYLGEAKLRSLGIEWNARSFNEYYTVRLDDMTVPQIMELRGWLDEAVKLKVKGPKVLVHDIDVWLRALKDAGKEHPRTVHQFASLLTEYLRKSPGHRVYKRLDAEGLAYAAYYVNEVEFHPESHYQDHRTPPWTEMELFHIELGGRVTTSVSFHSEDIFGMSASEALAKAGYFIEIDEFRAAYLKEVSRFNAISPVVGEQYIARGYGTDNLDGNGDSNGWSRYHSSKLPFNNDKVVIDVFYEDTKERKDREGYLNQGFWRRETPKALVEEQAPEDDEATDDSDAPLNQIEVPIHPFCAVFDLRRHLRMRVHVNYLTVYEYDTHMDKKLVLPEVTKNLVSTLIAQSKTGFSDIIVGKGMGVTVLLGGPPGVGKTLTAEVFAESRQRPLYSIQAAQLGIESDHIEKNLVRFLARGSRWNAIVLIDEADVYIRSRDRDMEHNAIVAALLRVMEYQSSILFMTTNLAAQTDDAIVSRCIARINYGRPSKDEQRQIWRILADINSIALSDKSITTFVDCHPNLTGRDIKQLLKLGVLHAASNGGSITPEVIDFVSQFQPTIEEVPGGTTCGSGT